MMMPNYKRELNEIELPFVTFFLSFLFLFYFLPDLSILLKIIFPLLFTILVELAYYRIRNQTFTRKVYKLYVRNRYDKALLYMNNMTVANSRWDWLKAEKAIAILLSQNCTLFLSYKDTIEYPKLYYLQSSFYRLEVVNYVVAFLLGKGKFISTPKHFHNRRRKLFRKDIFYILYMAVNRYQENACAEAIYFANQLLSCHLDFFEFAACFVLVKSYEKIGDREMVSKFSEMLWENDRFDRYRREVC